MTENGREARRRRTLLRALARLADDEPGELRKLSRLRTGCYWAGTVIIAVALSAAPWGWPGWVAALVGAAGGLVIGLAVHYDNALNQWPVLGRYFDRAAVRRDVAALDGE